MNSYLELRQSAINEQWANEQIPWMEQLIGKQRYVEAFDLVTQLRNRVPDRPEVSDLLMRTSQVSQITTQPSGAEVAYRFFGRQEDRWITLGVTPLQARVPNGAKVWRFTKEGYEAQVLISRYNPSGYFGTIRLQPTDSVPDGMVFVQGGEISDPPLSPRLSVGSFYIDRYEVTNEDYQAFVDAGGYSDPSYWREMVFVNKERKIDRSEAMQLFVDSTGRAGPAGWVLGQHPDGQEAWPVRGVSWYEAAAYARFVGKALPTAAHWSVAAFDRNVFGQKSFDASVAGRNLQIDKLAPIGTSHRSRVDARDMFGNVREWVLNEKGEDRVVMGASWKQYVSMGWLVDSAPPLDRSEINGIRLARYDRDVELEAKIEPRRITRNPISEEAYQLLLSDLTYAPVDIDIADIRQSVKGLNWSHDSIPISLPDGDVLIVHVFLPTSAPKPYQVVLYAPGAGSYYVREFTGYDPGLDPRFIIKTGRALVFPEYEGTFSRRSSVNDATEVWDAQAQRDDMITRRNETAIALDYVASREDLAADQIAYLGFSVSASLYIPILAVENRFKQQFSLVAG